MESHEQHTLWAQALENYQAAVLTAQHGWHNVSVACSYYAVFTAMWVALGDPPRRSWEHRSIVGRFARGEWRTPYMPVEHERIRAIRTLYTDRLTAHYKSTQLSALDSTASLTTARHALRLVADAAGLPQARNTLMQSTKPLPHDLLALVHKAAPAEARIVPLDWAYEAEDYNIAIVMPDGVTRERTRQIEERLTDAVMDWDEAHGTYTITMVWQQHEMDRAGAR